MPLERGTSPSHQELRPESKSQSTAGSHEPRGLGSINSPARVLPGSPQAGLREGGCEGWSGMAAGTDAGAEAPQEVRVHQDGKRSPSRPLAPAVKPHQPD